MQLAQSSGVLVFGGYCVLWVSSYHTVHHGGLGSGEILPSVVEPQWRNKCRVKTIKTILNS